MLSRSESRKLRSASVSSVSVASRSNYVKLSVLQSKKLEGLSSRKDARRDRLPRRKDSAKKPKRKLPGSRSRLMSRLKLRLRMITKKSTTSLLKKLLQPVKLRRLRQLMRHPANLPKVLKQQLVIMTKMKLQCNPRTRKLLEPLLLKVSPLRSASPRKSGNPRLVAEVVATRRSRWCTALRTTLLMPLPIRSTTLPTGTSRRLQTRSKMLLKLKQTPL